jgi:hypothetical protein
MFWLFVVGVILTLAVPHFGAMILAGGFILWMLGLAANRERY